MVEGEVNQGKKSIMGMVSSSPSSLTAPPSIECVPTNVVLQPGFVVYVYPDHRRIVQELMLSATF